MMMQEFTDRTGFEPTAREYAEIEKQYMDFDGDKDAFCKAFVDQGCEKQIYTARTTRIEYLESQIADMKKAQAAEVAKLAAANTALEAELEKELEWRAAQGYGTNMTEKDYQHLAADVPAMSDDEALALVHETFGFDPEKVKILHTVHTYEVNRHRGLRKAQEFTRQPRYSATDWNYIRFTCCAWAYEMIDGVLVPYCE